MSDHVSEAVIEIGLAEYLSAIDHPDGVSGEWSV